MRDLWILCLMTGLAACSGPKPEPYHWRIPEGFPLPVVPADNPMNNDKVTLGRAIFYDPALSFNGLTSCASCHQQAFGFAESRQSAKGTSGEVHRRNSLALINIAYNGSLTWAHSGLATIEQQILIPMFSEQPIELGITGYEDVVLMRFSQDNYPELFERAFGDAQASYDKIVKALASFVRSLTSFNSPFDRYAYAQEDDALSESAIRGLNLFFSERLECFHCHGGFNFTQSSKHADQQLDLGAFHNTGLYDTDGQGTYPTGDTGLFEVTGQANDMGRFRAPTLRNIAVTAPYMHDGSIGTLSEVLDFYAAGGRGPGINNPLKSVFIKGFVLNKQEKQDILNFLNSLTDPNFLNNPDFAAPNEADR